MPNYKLIALDLDGTLLDSSLKLSEGNYAALRKAVDAGVHVILATSRWFGLAKRTADRLEIDTPIIASNGAIAKRPGDGSELMHLYVDAEAAREVVALGDDSGWEMYTTLGDDTYMKMRPGIIPDKLPAGLKVADRQSDEFGDRKPTCTMAFGPEAVDEVEQQFVDRFDGRAQFSINRPGGNLPPYFVMTHPDAEKAAALKVVCEHLGVAMDEVIAMGDSESDLEMLRISGLGIAMGNGADVVKETANDVAPSNNDDGVAWAVEKFLL
jgi:Cof subfamily protein (haloacid dehalogenase superfamily)